MSDLTRRLREAAVGPLFYTLREAADTIERLSEELDHYHQYGHNLVKEQERYRESIAALVKLGTWWEQRRPEVESMRDLLCGFCGALENGEIASDLYDAAKAHVDGTWKPPTVVVSEESEALSATAEHEGEASSPSAASHRSDGSVSR